MSRPKQVSDKVRLLRSKFISRFDSDCDCLGLMSSLKLKELKAKAS